MSALRIGVAVLDPPFYGMAGSGGLNVDLGSAIAQSLGSVSEFIELDGQDPENIVDALSSGACDCAMLGASVTAERGRRVAFAPPYLISGQALAVDTHRFPQVYSVDDLAGLTIGVQRGSPGVQIAERLVDAGRAARVRTYDGVASALKALGAGGCDVFIALAPVLIESVRSLAGVEVVQRGLSTEELAIAVAPADTDLLDRITAAQADLEADGTLQSIRRKWLGNPFTDQRLALH